MNGLVRLLETRTLYLLLDPAVKLPPTTKARWPYAGARCCLPELVVSDLLWLAVSSQLATLSSCSPFVIKLPPFLEIRYPFGSRTSWWSSSHIISGAVNIIEFWLISSNQGCVEVIFSWITDCVLVFYLWCKKPLWTLVFQDWLPSRLWYRTQIEGNKSDNLEVLFNSFSFSALVLLYFSTRILSWNVRGAGRHSFSPEFAKLVRKQTPDICFLSETKLTARKVVKFTNKWSYLFGSFFLSRSPSPYLPIGVSL